MHWALSKTLSMTLDPRRTRSRFTTSTVSLLTNYDLLYIRSLMMPPMKYIYIDDEDHDLHGVWSCSKSYYSHCCWLIKFLKIFWVYFHILWFDSYYQWTDICWKQSNCLKWKLVLFFNLFDMVLSSGFI